MLGQSVLDHLFDCVVVGAGPAGTATAYHLARQGHSVLVLERDVLPRYKPCSGAVSPSVATHFDFDFAPVIDRTLRRVRYTWKLGDPVEGVLETAEPIWMVQRDRFDHFLVQQAQQRGAQVQDGIAATAIQWQGDRWAVHTPAGTVSGTYLVAADGATGPVTAWLGLTPAPLRQADVLEIPTATPVSDDCAFSFDFGLVKGGCLWSFPKRQSYSLGAAAFCGRYAGPYTQAFERYAASLKVSLTEAQRHTHPLRLWAGNQTLHSQNALVVGEAAAIVDPLSAEGIRPAIVSGVQAANAIHRALAGDAQALATYTQTLHQSWGEDMQWARRIAGLFFRVPGIGYRVGIKRPTATQRLGQLLAGEVRYADIAQRVMKRMGAGAIPGLGR